MKVCIFGRPFVKRFALCYQTVISLSCLSVTLVYCGQTVGWITSPTNTSAAARGLHPVAHSKQITTQRNVKLECGPMPNVMAALPNIGGALCSTPQIWLTPTTRVPCSNAAKTRNPLKFAGVPQTRQQISATSRPKFTILSGHVEEVLVFNKFFFRLSIHALVPKI